MDSITLTFPELAVLATARHESSLPEVLRRIGASGVDIDDHITSSGIGSLRGRALLARDEHGHVIGDPRLTSVLDALAQPQVEIDVAAFGAAEAGTGDPVPFRLVRFLMTGDVRMAMFVAGVGAYEFVGLSAGADPVDLLTDVILASVPISGSFALRVATGQRTTSLTATRVTDDDAELLDASEGLPLGRMAVRALAEVVLASHAIEGAS